MIDAKVEEVADGVYAYVQHDGTWWINNTGFLVGPQGVISIDACSTEARTRAYLEAIGRVTDRPVRTLLNTHHHGDHTFGNHLFTGATIIGQEGVRDGIAAWGLPSDAPIWTPVDWGDIRLEPPFVTFTDVIAVWHGDSRLEFRHVGQPAHTTNDSYLWLPEQSVLFTGDLGFTGGTPFCLQGSVRGLREVIEEQLLPLGAETVVCGHGPVTDNTTLEAGVGYLRLVERLAADGIAAGLTPLEVARDTDLGEYADWSDSERLVGNLHRAYADAGAAELDLVAAIGDMITFNGGPLHTHA